MSVLDNNLNKCYIGGCVRNCAKYIEKVFINIKKIGLIFDDYHVIIAYDHSHDNSLQLLSYEKESIKNMDILINDNLLSVIRTENISNARNAILNKIRDLEKWEYFIMIDCDDVSEHDIDLDVLKKSLIRNDWDSLSFNRKAYYDIWALSLKPYIFSCWNFPEAVNVITEMTSYVNKSLKELNDDELLECYSAFNGFAIYRTAIFINSFYDWKNPIHLMIKEELYENFNILNKIPFLLKNNCDCEHRHFHLFAIRKYNAKIRISPLYLFLNTKYFL